MPPFSDFIERLRKNPELLLKLIPTEPLFWNLSEQFRALDDAALAGGHKIIDPDQFRLVRGGVLYALDELDPAHHLFQEEESSLGSYWHGMLHRREGDFDNARYWFRRAGKLAVFADLHAAAHGASPTMARQATWDAYLLTGLCEQARFGGHDLIPECQRLLRAEWEGLLTFSWERSVAA
jgi:hypothetical protein